MRRITAVALSVLVCLSGCAAVEVKEETPNEAVAVIAQLYEARDFETLIRTRYAEISKVESDAQFQALVTRFQKLFADQDKLEGAVSIYKSVLGSEPELSEDGTVATYKIGEAVLRLFKMPSGQWGFHL